ncbi:MAG: hypothetical protein NWF06_08815 [Candidatus Bathyarchaeota archaeon]|nr:hypothetical protein [Candidatus Bathyarchaeum sp.]
MNKYALTLPLAMLSVVLGYFCPSLQIQHICMIASASTIFVAISVYMLFLKPQKAVEEKLKREQF